jgi:hypothetical protein
VLSERDCSVDGALRRVRVLQIRQKGVDLGEAVPAHHGRDPAPDHHRKSRGGYQARCRKTERVRRAGSRSENVQTEVRAILVLPEEGADFDKEAWDTEEAEH